MSILDNTRSFIEIPLTKGILPTIVSPEDADLNVFKWRSKEDATYHVIQHLAFRVVKTDGKAKKVFIHRVILSRMLSRPLEKHELVDHINGNPLDNRRENLRLATSSQNNHNTGVNRKNTSGYKGVTWNKQIQLWVAKISCLSVEYYLGCFYSREDAAVAYNHAALLLHGEFARFNEIPGWETIEPKRSPGRGSKRK